jgi:hypothetical protein
MLTVAMLSSDPRPVEKRLCRLLHARCAAVLVCSFRGDTPATHTKIAADPARARIAFRPSDWPWSCTPVIDRRAAQLLVQQESRGERRASPLLP